MDRISKALAVTVVAGVLGGLAGPTIASAASPQRKAQTATRMWASADTLRWDQPKHGGDSWSLRK